MDGMDNMIKDENMKAGMVDKIAHVESELLDARDICQRLSVSRSTFERWLRSGNFVAADFRIGNSPRWMTETLKDWLISRKAGTKQ